MPLESVIFFSFEGEIVSAVKGMWVRNLFALNRVNERLMWEKRTKLLSDTENEGSRRTR